jgi:hypothetical protein
MCKKHTHSLENIFKNLPVLGKSTHKIFEINWENMKFSETTLKSWGCYLHRTELLIVDMQNIDLNENTWFLIK